MKFNETGGVVVWRASDTAGMPPADIVQRFPGPGAGSATGLRMVGYRTAAAVTDWLGFGTTENAVSSHLLRRKKSAPALLRSHVDPATPARLGRRQAQGMSWMKRGHRADYARAGVVLEPTPTGFFMMPS